MKLDTLHRRAKYLPRYFSVLCVEKREPTSSVLLAVVTAVAAIVLPSFAVAFVPSFVEGQVLISEILYDVSGTDTDREWVEVFNAGPSSVHFTDWKFFEANTNHGVTSLQGGENLGVGAYAVIADNPTKFLQDWPSYSGILFDSTFSLGNSGETLAIHMPPPDLTETDLVSYQGAWGAGGNGNSLQRINVNSSTFSEASPTPGTGSLSSSSTGSSSSSDTGGATTTAQNDSGNSSGNSVVGPPPKVVADGGSDRTVIVGADTEFRARAYDEKENLIDFARFHWNFGDGSIAEMSTVLHRFDYPGRYVVVLEIPEEKDSVSDQIFVTVEPMKLALSLMPDGGLAIENRAGRTLELSRWGIRSLGRVFTIPDQTFILANATLRISPRTLGFSSSSDIELDFPSGVFALAVTPPATTTSSTTPAAPLPLATPSSRVKTMPFATDMVTEALPAIAENALTEPETSVLSTQANSSQVAGATLAFGSLGWWFGALGLAALAAGSLALARRYSKKEWDIEEISETR